jgi:type II secretory pathway pseudopilin PulG
MYCNKCGSEVPNGSRFCPGCGAGVASGPAPQQPYSPNDYSARTTYNPQLAPVKKGMPVWGWLLIGCGVLLIIPVIGMIAAISVPTLISTRDAAMESFATGVLATVRSSQAAYYAKNEKYGDLKALADDGYLDSRFTGNNITDFDGRAGVNISFTTSGKTYKCTIEVPNVGTLTLEESGEINGP